MVVAAVAAGFVFLPGMLAAFLLPPGLFAEYTSGTSALGLTLQLSGFAIPLWILRVMMRRVHDQETAVAFGRTDYVFDGARLAFVNVFVVLFVFEAMPPWPDASTYVAVRPVATWALALGPGILAILVQVTAEEGFFRGYLQQRLAALDGRPLVWMVAPSVFFGALHYFNGSGPAEGVLWALFATLLGLACADLTARHGTIGPAIGLHLTMNIFSFCIVGMDGAPQSGLALFLLPYQDRSLFEFGLSDLLSPWGVFQALSLTLYVGCLWLAARIGIRR